MAAELTEAGGPLGPGRVLALDQIVLSRCWRKSSRRRQGLGTSLNEAREHLTRCLKIFLMSLQRDPLSPQFL